MKTLLLLPALLILMACSKNDGPEPSSGLVKPGTGEARLKKLYTDIDQSAATVKIYDEDGRIVKDGISIKEGGEVSQSNGFVVITNPENELQVFNYRGQLLLDHQKVDDYDFSHRIFVYRKDSDLVALDAEGRRLSTGSQSVDRKTKIWVSDNIVAFTAERRVADQLTGEKDGIKTYSTKSEGRFLWAYTRQGRALSIAAQPLHNDEPRVFISNHLIGLVELETKPGKLIKEENGIQTYEGIPVGQRLFTYTDDGREIYPNGEAIDENTKIEFTDNFVRLGQNKFYMWDGTVR